MPPPNRRLSQSPSRVLLVPLRWVLSVTDIFLVPSSTGGQVYSNPPDSPKRLLEGWRSLHFIYHFKPPLSTFVPFSDWFLDEKILLTNWLMPLLLQIIEVLNALETFSVLSESKIEGIETISNRFQHMYSALKKKPYDPLDHRKPDFEADFFEFRRQISDIEVCKLLNLSVSLYWGRK